MRVCCPPHPGFSPRSGPQQIAHQIPVRRFDFSTHFRCISRKTTKRDAFGWGRCQRKSGGAPWNQLWQIVRLMLLLEDLTPGPRSGSALHRYRRPPGAGGGALLCPLMQSRGALVGGRLTGEHWCVPGRWEPGRACPGAISLSRMTGWLSRGTGRLFRLCGYPEGLGCYPVGRTESYEKVPVCDSCPAHEPSPRRAFECVKWRLPCPHRGGRE